MRAAGAGLLVLFALGCAGEKERPSPPTCVGEHCGSSKIIGAGMNGSGGTEGVGGADAGTAQSVVLTGNVLVLNDDFDFATGTYLNDTVNLETDGSNGLPATGIWDGINPFVIANTPAAAPVWVYANPPNAVADDALPGVEPVNTETPDANGQVNADIALVHASAIEQIFDLASVPLTMDTTRAQIILLLETEAGAGATPVPLAGENAQSASATNVIYAASNSFSDVATVTDNTGVVVLANVTAAAWPGAVIDVQFSGARTSGAQIRAVSGAVTLATISP